MYSRVDRREFKFQVPLHMRDAVVEQLEQRIALDENAGSNSIYPIVSQYYDSDDRECYWEKLEGLKHRRKLRVRVYGSENADIPPTVFIEVKAKSFTRGVKRRLMMPLENAVALAQGDSTRLEQVFGGEYTRYERMVVKEIEDLIERRNFVPSVAIRYDRLAFQGGVGREDLRVTFDYNVRCRFRDVALKPDCQDFDHHVLDPELCLMELKTIGPVPIWLRDVLTEFRMRPRGFSKYCTAIENFDPTLAGNSSAIVR